MASRLHGCYNYGLTVASVSDLDDRFHKRVRAFRRDLSGLEQGDAESLHRVRIASRRLRELVPLLGLDADTARKLRRRLGRVTQQLGVVRELDVAAQLAAGLSEQPRYSRLALARVGLAV